MPQQFLLEVARGTDTELIVGIAAISRITCLGIAMLAIMDMIDIFSMYIFPGKRHGDVSYSFFTFCKAGK